VTNDADKRSLEPKFFMEFKSQKFIGTKNTNVSQDVLLEVSLLGGTDERPEDSQTLKCFIFNLTQRFLNFFSCFTLG
jgi:hypothetical protein